VRDKRGAGFPQIDFSTLSRLLVAETRQHSQRLDRFRVVVETDDGSRYRLTVSDEAVFRIGIRQGDELTASQVAELDLDVRRVRACDLALDALARRPRSRRELEILLRRRGVAGAEAHAVLNRLQGAGHLDDARFAEAFVRSRVAGPGASVWLLRRDLGRKGVAREVADAAIAAVMDQESVDETALAEREARKKMRSLARLDRSVARRRLVAHLRRRGFSTGVIGGLVRDLMMSAQGERP
jgi:SOS response regulatory protein OraA/RecX